MRTSPRKRLRTVVIGLAAAAAVAFSTVPAITSAADVPTPSTNVFANSSNASDPSIYRCGDNREAYCMVTSEDLGVTGLYPMNRTLAYYSTDGLSWTAAAEALKESNIPGVPANSKHLWAPGVRFTPDPQGPDTYKLYVPDLTGASRYTSRIYVGTSSDGALPFTTTGTRVSGVGNTSNYMSDPEVFYDLSASPITDYLLWANGDGKSCGQLSIEKMTNSTTLAPLTSTHTTSNLSITGWPADAWATCTWNPTKPGKTPEAGVIPPPSGEVPVNTVLDQPYVEGATLYKFSNFKYVSVDGNTAPGPYTLVFAVKPSSVPSQCSTANGQPGTANEVIAYATSSTVTGPYTYQGIIMCGSSSEWTNQATIEEVQAENGEWRLVLVYHDGPSGTSNRKLHSECLLTNGSLGFKLASSGVGVTRTKEGATNLSGTRAWCLNTDSIIALKAPDGKYVQSNVNGQLKTGGTTIGLWEQFEWVDSGVGTDLLIARNQQKGVTRAAADGALVANSTTGGDSYVFVPVSGNTYRLKHVDTGKYVVVGTDGFLRATATSAANGTIFTKQALAK